MAAKRRLVGVTVKRYGNVMISHMSRLIFGGA